ncbi:hypothetical protein LTR99_010692 [Exophiala xenobiotica]|uniref:NACHT domain-containing protein n=1 Tax=Vermiconidia calcicola TaxID=1690605 RepID=A0AAV9Q1I7_9PEZI|nr:hypothetical protein LTR96_001834 [Exophiala xenobiotica]KAK5533902.1 hypothetical protein LTR25_006882 [Vermiconidia calcicola]KAK5546453.1 hypothetical protein LTR23_003558 [Chaetothyriales sp. CCFEE 6169]KAK5291839.1 hypothetical protein LTR99_010692 [Exophiala xenobiotica]KAK5342112.1 hypothetical protein LTR98_002906 [Exophiala xenobiotica]
MPLLVLFLFPSLLLVLMHHISRRAGEDDITRRNDFKALSDGQKDIISQVLGRLQIVSTDVQLEIRASQTVVMTHLAAQDASAQQSESRVMRRFDALDVVTKDAARANHGLTSHLQYQGKESLKHRLLDALAFPEMTERRNMIEGRVDDFGETYQWIFSSQGGSDSWEGRHGFVKWLHTGTKIFWINGKPGSGKSTLMDFIYQNLQPHGLGFAHLEKWAAPRPVRLLSFWFFRPATSVLLKSLQGFWRSLCFQILDSDRTLVDKIQQDAGHSVPEALKSCLQIQGSHTQTWTDAELKSWFIYLVTHSGYDYCLLVDGLDEVTGNRQALLDIVQEIVQNSEKIKICCSSRPEAPFARLLQGYPSLRLQDFNFDDIKEHCRKRLDGTRAVVYADPIARRAEGVFLWAYLVTEDLRTAVNQGDTEEDLKLRLEECPVGMNELFTLLLERQDKFYAKYPKPYLHLLDVATKKNEQASVLELFIASEDQDKVRSCFPVNLEKDVDYLAALTNSAVDFEANLVARCAGLVECTYRGRGLPDIVPYENLARMRVLEVRFIHRSAQDFLIESESGRALLHSCSISEQEALKRLTTASALSFLSDDYGSLKSPLHFATYLREESWTAFETSIADNLFSAEHHRDPFKFDYLDHEMTCPQLSPVENLSFYVAMWYDMTAYLASKLTEYEPTKASTVAGISMCYYINNRRGYFRMAKVDFIGVLQPYPCHARTLTLQCKFRVLPVRDWDTSHYVTAGPLWQHLYLALATTWFRYFSDLGRESPEVSTVFDFIFSSCKGEELDLECRILLIAGGRWTRIVPAPDDDKDDADGAVLNRTDTWGDVCEFKIRMAVRGFAEMSGSSVDFLQYSPRGLDRFFDIENSINKTLRMAFDRYRLQRAFTVHNPAAMECVTAILNGHLDDMSSSEVAKVVCFQDDEPWEVPYDRDERIRFIFSKGRIHGTSCGEWEEWEKRLKAGIFDHDFETDPEHDPILSEIMTRLRSRWPKEPEWAESDTDSDEVAFFLAALSALSDDEDAASSAQNGRTDDDN